jgi:hypothetical protein
MLDKKHKEKLRKNSWDKAFKDHSNRYQAWDRIRLQSIKAIDELILLASRLPDDKQDKIFSYENIEKFILAILYKRQINEYYLTSALQNIKDTSFDTDDYRRIHICLMLINNCIDYFIKEIYKNEEFKILSGLVKPGISQLEQSKSICNSIIDTMELSNIKKEEGKRKFKFLFNLDKNNFLDPEKFKFLSKVNKLRYNYYYWVSNVTRKNEKVILCKLDILPIVSEILNDYSNNKSRAYIDPFEHKNLINLKPILAKLIIKDDKSILVEYRNSLDQKMFEIQLDITKINGYRNVFGKKNLF